MLLEGLEVVFIVIAVGAGRGLLVPAGAGAFAACLLVAGAGFVVHRPLARVPENTLKFAVGIMLSAFGVFWTGEGIGVPWPGEDLAIVAYARCSWQLRSAQSPWRAALALKAADEHVGDSHSGAHRTVRRRWRACDGDPRCRRFRRPGGSCGSRHAPRSRSNFSAWLSRRPSDQYPQSLSELICLVEPAFAGARTARK